MTTEVLKVHGFTSDDDLNQDAEPSVINDYNAVLPGSMFAVYDSRSDYPGVYVVEHMELEDYTEAGE